MYLKREQLTNGWYFKATYYAEILNPLNFITSYIVNCQCFFMISWKRVNRRGRYLMGWSGHRCTLTFQNLNCLCVVILQTFDLKSSVRVHRVSNLNTAALLHGSRQKKVEGWWSGGVVGTTLHYDDRFCINTLITSNNYFVEIGLFNATQVKYYITVYYFLNVKRREYAT